MRQACAAILIGFIATHTFAAGFEESLTKMGETNLTSFASRSNDVCFRFTILPTWGNPVCIRIQQDEKIFRLVAKRLEGEAGYRVGKLVETKERVLSERESKELLRSIDALHFFEMPTTESNEDGRDGESWYLEGVQHGEFHKIERWTAGFETKKRGLNELVKFCALLVKFAELEEPPKNKGHEIFERNK
ncbi:MAG TPA: hypothetical protein VJT54_17280 [Verrucomicrobiae bacterium]|nr:hypothetical protein [Verrucomicrobiae bacterium]